VLWADLRDAPGNAGAQPRQNLRGVWRASVRGPQELSVLEQHHPGLPRDSDAAGICLREPAGDAQLRLWELVHGLNSRRGGVRGRVWFPSERKAWLADGLANHFFCPAAEARKAAGVSLVRR